MHAVVVSVTISNYDQATNLLREQIVPQVKQAPGFVAGYWVALDGHEGGRSIIAFESEEAARNAATMIEQSPEEGVSIDSVDVGEVAASA
jgi:hypothetical protein